MNSKTWAMGTAAALAVGAVALLAVPTTADAAGVAAPPPGTVTVDGVGNAVGAPDILAVDFGIDVTRADVSAALGAASSAANAVTSTLTRDGVAAADVATSQLAVSTKSGKHGVVTGYEVTEVLSATLRTFSSAGATLGDVVGAGAGAVTIQDVNASLSDPSSLGAKARSAAFADARGKAQQYADLAGRKLGRVVSVNASSNSPSDTVSSVKSPATVAVLGPTAGNTSAGPVAVSGGSVPVSVTVTVVWALG